MLELLLTHQFIQHAFLVGTLVSILSAIIGYFVVLRSQAFDADSLSHIGFAGATGAAVLGFSSLFGMFGLTGMAALLMGILGKRIKGKDIETGMVLSFALGLGVLFLNIYTNSATEAVGVLFGSILSVTEENIIITLITSILVLLVLGVIFRPLLFSSIDPEVAEARGIPVNLLSIVFMILLAVTVAESVQVVGVLLVFALLIAPAATAQHLTQKPSSAIILSILLSLIFTWVGLILAFVGNLPVSFYISTIAALTYLLVVNTAHRMSPHIFKLREHADTEKV